MTRWPYCTTRWKKLRRAKLGTDPLCEPCERAGRLAPATEVDHKVRLGKGGAPFDWENLQSICRPCHLDKTSQERKRPTGCDPATGLPIDGKHWWNNQISQGCAVKPSAIPQEKVSRVLGNSQSDQELDHG